MTNFVVSIISGMGVMKTLFINFSIRDIYDITES